MNIKKIQTLIYYSLLIQFLISCSPGAFYKDFHKFEKLSWNRFDFLKFEMPVEASSQEYDIYFRVRHLPEFPYKELEINFTMFLPSGEMRTADHILQFASRDGELFSECMGDYCDIDFLMRKSFVFTETGTVRFEIENKNTKFETPGIIEAGVIVKKSE
jgi:gliding motility-associated lipoprotein GldH